MARESKYKEEYCEQLINFMSGGLSYEAFAGELEVARSTLYEWEKHHEEWVEAKDRAFSKCQLYWEKAGNHGMFMGGKDNPFNATVWIFNMKNRFSWRDKKDVEHSVGSSLENIIGKSFGSESDE